MLRSALALLERAEGPLIEDYPHDAPDVELSPDGWSCPVALPSPQPGESEAEQLSARLVAEVQRLHPWFDEGRKARGRTTVGLSGLDPDAMEQAADFVARFAAGERTEPPEGLAHEWPATLRFMADDIKAFYLEAATAQPGRSATSADLNDWLYKETTLGGLLYDLRDKLAASEDPREKGTAGVLIPLTYAQRPE